MPYNILVIDDDRQTAMFTADMLRLDGHVVALAFGARSALHQLSEVIPDIVFVDLNMPGVDGLEICRYLRRDPLTARLPIVVVSANGEDGYKQAAAAAGANDYLVKPAMVDDLNRMLERYLGGTIPSPRIQPNAKTTK